MEREWSALGAAHSPPVQGTNPQQNEDGQIRAGDVPGVPSGLPRSHLKGSVAFRQRLVDVLDGLYAVAVKLFRSSLEFVLGLFKMPDGCIDPRMMLGRRTCCRRDWRRRGRGGWSGLRGPWLRMKNQW